MGLIIATRPGRSLLEESDDERLPTRPHTPDDFLRVPSDDYFPITHYVVDPSRPKLLLPPPSDSPPPGLTASARLP
jgi:hypothetical protein